MKKLQKDSIDLILISTHGGIIRNIIYSLKSELRPDSELIADVKIHEGGYTVLDFDGENFKSINLMYTII